MTDDTCIAATREWLEKAVIGLNLCPFAKAVDAKNQIRIVVSAAATSEALLEDLMAELDRLDAAAPAEIETTLLVHPHVLADFLDFNDFLEVADAAVEELGLEGRIQVAAFHPDFQFADTEAGDIGNYSNRSPYPILHLLREESVERAVDSYPDTADIYKRNIATLRRLGHSGWQALWEESGTSTAPESP